MYETKIQYNMSFWAKFQNKKVKKCSPKQKFLFIIIII